MSHSVSGVSRSPEGGHRLGSRVHEDSRMKRFPDLELLPTDGVVSLRRFTTADVADVTRALQDTEIVRWTASIPVPYTEAGASGWIALHEQWWNEGSTASFAVVDAAGGSLLGNVNVIVQPDWVGRAAMMYWVAAWGRGRGVATRALSLAGEWAIEVIVPRELFLETLEGNIASERVAEKAGYAFDGYRSEEFTRPASRGAPETLRVKKWVLSRGDQEGAVDLGRPPPLHDEVRHGRGQGVPPVHGQRP